MQTLKELRGSKHAALLIAMNPGKQADTEVAALLAGTRKKIPRQTVWNALGIVVSQMRSEKML